MGNSAAPNARLLAGAFAPVLGAFALATGQWQAFADMPFPGGALGQLIADSLDAVLGGMGFYPSPTFQTGLGRAAVYRRAGGHVACQWSFIRAMQTPIISGAPPCRTKSASCATLAQWLR